MRAWAINLTFEEETMKIVCTKDEAMRLVKTCIAAIYEDDCKCCVLHRFCAAAVSEEEDAIDALIEIENEK